MKTIILSIIALTTILYSVKAQNITHQTTHVDVNTYQIDYFNEHGGLLNSWLHIGEIDDYIFDTYDINDPGEGVNSFGNTMLEETLWLPDDNGGARPLDICYNPFYNKYYIYGGRRLIIIDGLSNEVIEAVTVSDGGFIPIQNGYPVMPYQKRLVYNSVNHNVYCIAHGGEIIEINGSSNAIQNKYVEAGISPGTNHLIYYHPGKNKIYALVRTISSLIHEKLIVFNCQTNNVEKVETIGRVNDFKMNATGDKIYITGNFGFRVLNENDLTMIFENSSYAELGKVEYSDIGRIFCHKIGINQLISFDEAFNYTSTVINLPTNMNAVYCSEFVKGGTYNNIFLTGSSKVAVINCLNNTLINSADFPNSFGIAAGQNNLVYIGGRETSSQYGIRAYNASNGIYQTGAHHDYGIAFRLDYNSINQQLISGNFREGLRCVFNANCVYQNHWHTGGHYVMGCSNNKNSKVYLMQSSHGEVMTHPYDKHVVIINSESNNVETLLDLGSSYFSSATYNKQFNLVFISDRFGNRIFVIDGQTNNLVTTIQNIQNPYSVVSGTDNIVYVGGFERIYFIDVANNFFVYPHFDLPFSTPTSGVEDLIIDEDDNILFAGTGTKIHQIDIQNLNSPVAISEIAINGVKENMTHVKYDDINKIVMEVGTSHLVIYDAIDNTALTISSVAHDLVYNEFNKHIYALHSNSATGNSILRKYDIQGNLKKEIPFPTRVRDIVFNDCDNKIYLYGNDGSYPFKLFMHVFNCKDDETESTLNLDNQISGFSLNELSQYITKNAASNKIVTANWGLSNASIVKGGVDRLSLRLGWNWRSFPRLQRSGNEPDLTASVLSRIDIFPVEVYIEYLPDYINAILMTLKYNFFGGWTGDLNEVQSTLGYKLHIPEFEYSTPNISLYGAVVDPQTEFTIYPGTGVENWRGYFLEYPQDIFDCVPQEVMDDLTLIKTQYWSMARVPGQPWFSSGKRTPLSYGSMVIFRTTAQHTFSWIGSNNPKEEVAFQQSEYFEYEEKADYLPVFIEFDETSDVQEIGIIAGGEVIGAAVRYPSDTLVHVCAYLEGVQPGTPLEFETWNGYKSTTVKRQNYLAWNGKTGRKENRTIYAGEKVDAHLVSLKATEISSDSECPQFLTCIPNPFGTETRIEFSIAVPTKVSAEIWNISGQRVNTLMEGEVAAGSYSFTWNGDDNMGRKVPQGIYLVRVSTGLGNILTERVALIK